jgi:tyrosyl-tRNA synthetase
VDLSQPVAEVVKALGFARSHGDVRRVAQQKGLRLVTGSDGGEEHVILNAEETREPLAVVVRDKLDGPGGDCYLKVGRRLARIIL